MIDNVCGIIIPLFLLNWTFFFILYLIDSSIDVDVKNKSKNRKRRRIKRKNYDWVWVGGKLLLILWDIFCKVLYCGLQSFETQAREWFKKIAALELKIFLLISRPRLINYHWHSQFFFLPIFSVRQDKKKKNLFDSAKVTRSLSVNEQWQSNEWICSINHNITFVPQV